MIEWLEDIDRSIFLFLNGLNHPLLDQPMYYMSEEMFWLPLYLLFIWLVAKNYNWKIALWTLLGVALVVTIGDRVSVELFKNVFERYRPTRNIEIGHLVHTVNGYRGGKFGFVSSHATNYFGIATFLMLIFRINYGVKALWLLVWAALIAYTRIYLGVHYPADIVCGALLGMGIGYGVFYIFKAKYLKQVGLGTDT